MSTVHLLFLTSVLYTSAASYFYWSASGITPRLISREAKTQDLPDTADRIHIIRISELTTDLNFGPAAGNRSSCLSIDQDGRVVVETRSQVVPTSKVEVVVHVYEGQFAGWQRSNLQNILADEKLLSAPNQEYPRMSRIGSFAAAFDVSIKREHTVQELNYARWGVKGEDYPGEPKAIIEQQQGRALLLKPLMEWYHGINLGQFTPSTRPPTACAAFGKGLPPPED